MPTQEITLADWLERKYAEWQPVQDRRQRSIRAFADYLNVREPLLNMLFNGRRKSISQNTADKLAEKLGDEIYALIGKQKPDPDLRFIKENWHRIPHRKQRQIITLIEQEVHNAKQPASSG